MQHQRILYIKEEITAIGSSPFKQEKNANVITGLAIPCNPYYPKPYKRLTSTKLYDPSELMGGSDFWNFAAEQFLMIFSMFLEKLGSN
jgi:hypothetical protein